MKKIRQTKTAQISQFFPIVKNLREELKSDYVSVECTVVSSSYEDNPNNCVFQIAIQPGLDNTVCSLHRANSWTEFFELYHSLIKGDTLL